MGGLSWDREADQALKGVPFFARPLARRKIEERVAASGRARVTLADYQEAHARFRAVSAGKSRDEIKAMLPVENRPGVEMVILEACRSELADCPNRLLAVEDWRIALQEWIAASGLSERLRARVAEDKVLYHHKLKLAIAGCPNGCSRPQIADLACVGTIRPTFDPDACTACGACASACPDQALTVNDTPPVWDTAACQGCLACQKACPADAVGLSAPTARLLMGGKLGRHPQLAQAVAEVAGPQEAIAFMDEALERYLAQARAGERFAAYYQRTR
jgi:anaerobic sulfite reductase subunit C